MSDGWTRVEPIYGVVRPKIYPVLEIELLELRRRSGMFDWQSRRIIDRIMRECDFSHADQS